MRDLLKNGYTVYISKEKNKIKGLGLKKENGKGITPYEIEEDKIKVLGQMPGINNKLDKGETLLISRDYDKAGIRYKARFGSQLRQGPYGEEDCFKVSVEVEDEEFLGAILLINDAAAKAIETSKPPKILLRSYGEASYKEMS